MLSCRLFWVLVAVRLDEFVSRDFGMPIAACFRIFDYYKSETQPLIGFGGLLSLSDRLGVDFVPSKSGGRLPADISKKWEEFLLIFIKSYSELKGFGVLGFWSPNPIAVLFPIGLNEAVV